MNLLDFRDAFDPVLFDWLILPGIIFLARLVDVALGTLRIIFVSRSMRNLAPLVGFFESLIWLFAVSQIVLNLNNIMSYFAFAAGFATGNYVGIYLENKLAVGLLSVRVVTSEDGSDLINYLSAQNFGVTSISATGVSGKVRLIISVIKRKDIDEYLRIVKQFNPKAFISIEDVRSVKEGYFLRNRKTTNLFSALMQRK
jgi:uncharacterized protein YebE (UPF0316 family)